MPTFGVLRSNHKEDPMAPRPTKISDVQRRALTYAYNPFEETPIFPDDYFGFRTATLRSLKRRGLLKRRRLDYGDATITPAGELALGLSPHPASFKETLLEAMTVFAPGVFPPESVMTPDEMGDVWVDDEAILDGDKIAGALSLERCNSFPVLGAPGELVFLAETIACRLSAVGFEVEACITPGQVSFVWSRSMAQRQGIMIPDDRPYDLMFDEFIHHWDLDWWTPPEQLYSASYYGNKDVPLDLVGGLLHEALERLEVPMHFGEVLEAKYWWSSEEEYTGDLRQGVHLRVVLESQNPKYSYVVHLCEVEINLSDDHQELLKNVAHYVPHLLKTDILPNIWIVHSEMDRSDMSGLREPGRKVAVKPKPHCPPRW